LRRATYIFSSASPKYETASSHALRAIDLPPFAIRLLAFSSIAALSTGDLPFSAVVAVAVVVSCVTLVSVSVLVLGVGSDLLVSLLSAVRSGVAYILSLMLYLLGKVGDIG
jgi:hypothetical protein